MSKKDAPTIPALAQLGEKIWDQLTSQGTDLPAPRESSQTESFHFVPSRWDGAEKYGIKKLEPMSLDVANGCSFGDQEWFVVLEDGENNVWAGWGSGQGKPAYSCTFKQQWRPRGGIPCLVKEGSSGVEEGTIQEVLGEARLRLRGDGRALHQYSSKKLLKFHVGVKMSAAELINPPRRIRTGSAKEPRKGGAAWQFAERKNWSNTMEGLPSRPKLPSAGSEPPPEDEFAVEFEEVMPAEETEWSMEETPLEKMRKKFE